MRFGKLEDGKYFLDLRALTKDNVEISELEKELQEAKPKEVHLPEPNMINYEFFKETLLVNLVLYSEKQGFRIFSSEQWYEQASLMFAGFLGGSKEQGFCLQVPDQAKTLTVIPEQELVPERFYMGRGRNTNVALLHDETFITFCYKFGYPMHKYEGYLGADGEGNCFQPFLLLPTLEELLFPKPKIIPKEELEEYKFYHCLGGEHNIAQWHKNEGEFLTWGKGMISCFCHWTQEGPKYKGELVEGITCVSKKYEEITPFKKIGEGEMVEPFGTTAWERHYGKKIRLKEE